MPPSTSGGGTGNLVYQPKMLRGLVQEHKIGRTDSKLAFIFEISTFWVMLFMDDLYYCIIN